MTNRDAPSTISTMTEFRVQIRYGVREDAELLATLAAKTFFDTFARDNTPENMALHLKTSYSPEIQLLELTTPENIFLIAELGNVAVGFAQLVVDSRDDSLNGNKPVEIRRIYALQEYIGKGIGRALMSTCIQEASQRGCDTIWLGVWEKNPRAIEFYKKWGFREVGSHVFMVGDDPQKDYIMELELVNFKTQE